MRFYAACLASYNSGRLHGAWIEATTEESDMQAEIDSMLRRSPCPNVTRQEFACADADCGCANFLRDVSPYSPEVTACPDCGGPVEKVGEPFASAEEWAIHDSEGLGDIGEYAGLSAIVKAVEVAEAADEYGIPLEVVQEAFRDYGNAGGRQTPADFLQDSYRGSYRSWADMAEDLHTETGEYDDLPEWVKNHVDWESIGRDLMHEFNGIESGGDLFVFWQN